MTAPTRPALRYHGGKWRLAEWVTGFFPPHRTYVEPYGGAASVLLRKPRSYAEVYNEIDGEVVNVFRVLRDPDLATQLRHALELTPFSRVEYIGAWEPASDNPVERARCTLIKSFMGFGSSAVFAKSPRGMRTRATTHDEKMWTTGFRSNVKRSGTTPAAEWATWPEQIPAFIERLHGVVVENRPALDVMLQHDSPDVLHYVDPPYVLSARSAKRKRKGEYRHEMTDDQHRELARTLHELRGSVVLSGYASALYEELYAGWVRYEREHMADGARPRTEVVWLNDTCVCEIARGAIQQSLIGIR